MNPKAKPLRRRGVALIGTASLVILCLALAACGSSSGTSAGTTSAASSGGNAAGGHGSSTFATLQACLVKAGIKLQAPTGKPPKGAGTSTGTKPTGPPAGGGAGAGGFAKAPSGVSEAKYREALKKCGATNFSAGTHLNSTAAKAALTKYEACMAGDGVTLPKANLAGGGPIFKVSKTETSSATFKAAESKCQSDLKGVLAAGTGAGAGGPGGGSPGGGPPSGTPPAGGEPTA